MSCTSLLKADLKLNIILNLLEGGKKVAVLEQSSQTRITTISHVLKELLEMKLVTKTGSEYKLTTLGIIEAEICKKHLQLCSVVEKYKDFWLTHDISSIPSDLLVSIGALEKSVLVTDTEVDLYRVHENFIQFLLSAKTIYGISPIFHQDFVTTIKEVLDNGGKVQLIVTSKVLEKMEQTDKNMLNRYVSEGSLQIFLNENLRIALTLTEKELSFGLFSLSGKYDYGNDLICNDNTGYEWGMQLFRHIADKSVKM